MAMNSWRNLGTRASAPGRLRGLVCADSVQDWILSGVPVKCRRPRHHSDGTPSVPMHLNRGRRETLLRSGLACVKGPDRKPTVSTFAWSSSSQECKVVLNTPQKFWSAYICKVILAFFREENMKSFFFFFFSPYSSKN